MSAELKVGSLVLVAIAAMVYFVIRIEGIGSLGDADSYIMNVRFEDAAGIATDDPAYLAGVLVGHVAAVNLNMSDGTAEVQLRLRNDVQLREDAVAIVGSSGMLGESRFRSTRWSP